MFFKYYFRLCHRFSYLPPVPVESPKIVTPKEGILDSEYPFLNLYTEPISDNVPTQNPRRHRLKRPNVRKWLELNDINK